jgi:uncharacterized membrane protein YhaH (DUF805 family)
MPVDVTRKVPPQNDRLSRLQFLAAITFAFACTTSASLFAMLLAIYMLPDREDAAIEHFVMLGFFSMLFISIVLMRRRLHDLDRSGYWLILLLTPVVNIVLFAALCLAPGSKGDNHFGSPPSLSQTGKTQSSKPSRLLKFLHDHQTLIAFIVSATVIVFTYSVWVIEQ